MGNKIWALFCMHNAYDQFGPTLEVVWLEEPVVDQVREFLPQEFDTTGIRTLTQLNEFLQTNRKLVYHDTWYVKEVEAGVRHESE